MLIDSFIAINARSFCKKEYALAIAIVKDNRSCYLEDGICDGAVWCIFALLIVD